MAMSTDDRIRRRSEAAELFNQHETWGDGAGVANSLADGLTILRDAFFSRVQVDVEAVYGQDSMLTPLEPAKVEAKAKTEIEIYLIAESAAIARQHEYVKADSDWYVEWLSKLRLGDGYNASGVAQRLAFYLSKSPDDRRRSFSSMLERTVPEARRAPLIMYRLLPLAVSIMTSVAFGDHLRAEQARKRQVTWLPHIADCAQCHGRLLDNSEKCPQCGNPFWKFDWLTAE